MERLGRVIVERDDDARETRRLTDDALFLTSSFFPFAVHRTSNEQRDGISLHL